MPKLRMALILPAALFSLTAVSLRYDYNAPQPHGVEYYVGPIRLICRAVSAPAVALSTLNYYLIGTETKPGLGLSSILGFYMDDALFLLGVAILWYVVGRALDRRVSAPTEIRRHWVVRVVQSCLSGALGALLLLIAVHDLKNPVTAAARICAVLILGWSAILLLFGGRLLLQLISSARMRVSRSA